MAPDPMQVMVAGVLILLLSPFSKTSLRTRLIRATISLGVPFAIVAGLHLYGVLTTCGINVKEVQNIGTQGCQSLPLAQCEDLHVHKATGLVFGVCHDLDPEIRYKWFPGIGLFKHPEEGRKSRARIHVIDPKTRKHQPVSIENFDESFVGHGFDIWQEEAGSLYLHAVNHPPNPDYTDDDALNPKNAVYDFKSRSTRKMHAARDQIEIFKIAMPSSGFPSTAQHVRSIRHPLLVETNDLVSTGPDSFYVTNDKYYLDGHMRDIEGILTTRAPWTNIIHVTANLDTKEATQAVSAHVAADKLTNANGLGRGPGKELVYISAQAGLVHRLVEDPIKRQLAVIESHSVPLTLDNPFYLETDSYKTSGFYLSGLSKALDLGQVRENASAITGSTVWRVKKSGPQQSDKLLPAELIFQDDGNLLKTGSIAVVVPRSGTKGDMLVSGPWSDNVVVCPVNL